MNLFRLYNNKTRVARALRRTCPVKITEADFAKMVDAVLEEVSGAEMQIVWSANDPLEYIVNTIGQPLTFELKRGDSVVIRAQLHPNALPKISAIGML